MSTNTIGRAAARSFSLIAHEAAFGGSSVLGGTRVSTSLPVAVVGARKPWMTDAGYAQGDSRAWSPPV
ncbi:MAG TPA: hypothetical protein VFH54_10190 [Mycobacteriales bacterium]|nr:hypothetical protein [Mycobacteriales bacterium]